MTDDNSNNVDIADDLNAFEKEFFQTPVEEKEEPEVKEDEPADLGEDNDPPAPNEDKDESEDSEDAPDGDADDGDEEEEEEEEKEKPQPKKKGHSAQERIRELTAARREAERREQALLQRLEQLEASVEKKPVKEEDKTPLREMLAADAPNPDILDKDGNPVYPLGEFDPTYIRDLTRFTIEQETARARKESAAAEQKSRDEAIQNQLQTDWMEKVEKAEAELPDLRDRMETLTDEFANIDPAYGQYLASTIMISELGPELMYYLSENIGEAQKIVASGPAAATLALGRIEAQLAKDFKAEQETPKRNKRVSEAPEPPKNRTRGNGSKFTVSGDTDDLDAFEKVFFSK